MDSIFIKNYGQDLQDSLDFFVPHFPEENKETQSDCVGKEHSFGLAISPYNIANLHS